jgi:hypothetical protein
MVALAIDFSSEICRTRCRRAHGTSLRHNIRIFGFWLCPCRYRIKLLGNINNKLQAHAGAYCATQVSPEAGCPAIDIDDKPVASQEWYLQVGAIPIKSLHRSPDHRRIRPDGGMPKGWKIDTAAHSFIAIPDKIIRAHGRSNKKLVSFAVDPDQ